MRLVLAGLMMGLVGCQHTHLRYNTVRQAETLAEIYEQQVLDNLAKTVHDAHALPFFAYPKDGSTRITDEGSFNASPIHDFRSVFGIGGKRTGLEQWGLTPVVDPDKLQLMQCAYQRAVYGQPLAPCVDCCEREKTFEGKPDKKVHVFDTKTGTPKINEATNLPYDGRWLGDDWELLHSDGKHYPVDKKGFATVPTYDCDRACAISCGWLKHGSRCDVPRDCCRLTGFHCGTYVWVPECHRDKLSQLTLKILDYAVNDPAKVTKRTKEVTIFVDKFGRQTSEDEKHVGSVTATIGIDDLASSVAVIDNEGLDRDTKRKEKLEASFKQAGVDSDKILELEAMLFGPQTQVFASDKFREMAIAAELDPKKQEALEKAIKEYFEPSEPEVTPSSPSLIITPKQRSIDPGATYLNPLAIERSLEAIGN